MTSSILKFDEAWILQRFARLRRESRAICALFAANRLFPLYLEFHELSGLGDPKALSGFSGRLWQSFLGNEMTLAELEGAISKIHALIPSEAEDWPGEARAGAEEAASALHYAYRTRLSGDEREAIRALQCAYDTMHSRAQHASALAPSHPSYEMIILSHVEIQKELTQQRSDLTVLAKWEKSGCDRGELARLNEPLSLSSEELAGLIVDALFMGGVIDKASYERAMAIVTEELDSRKAVGDY